LFQMASLLAEVNVFKNKVVSNAELDGKTIGIFFVSHTELGSVTTIPLMRKFFKNREVFGLHDFEIVIACLDENGSDYDLLLEESDVGWHYLAFQNPLIKDLYDKYNIDQSPALLVVRPNGDVVTTNGINDIVTAYSIFDRWI
ncbi:hypothetical protein PENTCL1PPCAC_3336, partial [Pristionchus entomophagus]